MKKTEIKIDIKTAMINVPEHIKKLYRIWCNREEQAQAFPIDKLDCDYFKIYWLASTAQRELYRACQKI